MISEIPDAGRQKMGLPDMRRSGQRRPKKASTRADGAGRWRRLLLLVLFAIVLNLVQVIATLLAAVQFLFAWLGGGANPRLCRFGRGLGGYARQLICYLAYTSDETPFPFSDWPPPTADHGNSQP